MGDDDLTVRELEVLRLIRDGHRNKQDCRSTSDLGDTVNFHIKNLMDNSGPTIGRMRYHRAPARTVQI